VVKIWVMKVAGSLVGKILDSAELRLLFELRDLCRHAIALFGICLFTGCPVSGSAGTPDYRY